MKLLLCLLALPACVVCSNPTRLTGQAKDDDKLAVLERFAGEWEIDAKWATGEALKARNVLEWGLGKKILKTKTFVKDGDKEYQRYEGVMAWHPEKKSLFAITFAFDGSMTQVLIDAKDKDTLLFGWTPFEAEKPSPIRQTIRFLDNDHYQWVVSIRDGEVWKQLIDATVKRKGK